MKIRKLVPWQGATHVTNPFHIDPLFRGLDDVFRDFLGAVNAPATAENALSVPSVDFSETEDAYVLEAELPGVAEEDVNVELGDGILTLTGEKRSEEKSDEKNWHRVERTWGSFRRVLPLPGEVEADAAEATFERGVLTVRVPKSKESKDKVRRIEIRSKG